MSGAGYFKAKYAGDCPKCRAPIYVGEWVKFGEDEKVICKPCAEDEA